MKKNLLLIASLFAGIFATAQVDENGYTTVNITMEPNYAKQVFFKLATNTATPVAASSWDISFQKAPGGMGMGSIRVNDHKITTFYEASANIADWATINVANEATWTKLYNSETEWSVGAFDNGGETTPPFGFGWGIYDMATHFVNGSRIFVLKSSATQYTKIIITKLDPQATGGPTYTFKHSTWNGTEWSADQTGTAVVPDDSATDFVYFSFETNATVTVAPPTTDWDFVFTKYSGLVPAGETPVMYTVTGALHNTAAGIEAISVNEAGTLTNFTVPYAVDFSEDINTIGDKWKSFSGGAYVIPEKTYYVKYADGTTYRMYFLSFGGQTTGNLSFKYKDVTALVGTEEFNKTSFSIYPNPSSDKNITINHNLDAKGAINIYSLTGSRVYTGELETTGNQSLNLSSLASGMYIVKIDSGNYSETKKLIIQ